MTRPIDQIEMIKKGLKISQKHCQENILNLLTCNFVSKQPTLFLLFPLGNVIAANLNQVDITNNHFITWIQKLL